jgi:hypothetical protein
LIDRRQYTRVLHVQFFRAANSDTYHYLFLAKVRERLAVSKQTMHGVHMERFNLKKLNEVEGKEQNRVEISNMFADLENIDTEVDINRAWETIRQNIKISANESETFFSTYIATGEDGGLGRHLLVDPVLQASQVEVGISRKGTENNAGSMGTSETDSVNDTGVAYGSETNRSNQQGDQDSIKDLQAQPN